MKCRAKRKLNLARYQTKMAKTNSQMAIFLGKNELGQIDKQELSTKTEVKHVDPKDKAALDKAAKIIKLELTRKRA